MNQYQELYKKKQMSAEQALELIQDGDSMFSAQAAAEPQAILSKLQHLKETGVKGTTLNSCLPIQYYDAMKDPEMAGIMSHNGWFFTAGLRDAQKKKLVSAVPQSSTSVLRKSLQRLQAEGRRPVVLATVSPMDSHGYFSLSVSAIYERDLIDQGALVLLEVNPNFPRTFGDTQVHISEVDALVESDRPIPTKSLVPYTEVDKKIGAFVASLVEDGSTIQLGIGNIPNAVANELRSKRHLGIHTEMFTETMVDLIECGAVDNSQKGFMNGFSVCSFTMGSQRLYDFVHNNPSVLFKSSTFSNDPYTIARNNKFVSVNAPDSAPLKPSATFSGPAPEGSLRRYRARRCPRAGNPSLQCIPPIRPQMQTAKRCCTQKLSPSWRGAPRSPLPETTPTTWSRSMVSPGCGD